MKKMGKIVMLLTALLFNTLTGVVCASVLGFSPVAGAVGMNAVAAFMGMAPQSTSILREGVYTEIWVASFTDAWIETARTSLPRKARRGRIFYRCVD